MTTFLNRAHPYFTVPESSIHPDMEEGECVKVVSYLWLDTFPKYVEQVSRLSHLYQNSKGLREKFARDSKLRPSLLIYPLEEGEAYFEVERTLWERHGKAFIEYAYMWEALCLVENVFIAAYMCCRNLADAQRCLPMSIHVPHIHVNDREANDLMYIYDPVILKRLNEAKFTHDLLD